jgi:aryl-alcohol dehydrogenase-like predicted oxidoreductase
MRYRQLGRSGLLVSELGFGTMTFGNVGHRKDVMGSTDVAGARRQVDMCLDAGVNLIDTADVYAAGASEEIVGEVLQGRRERLLVATKARFPVGEGPNDAGLSRHHLIRSCESSLRRLRTDHIDLYQPHGWDGQTPVEETLEALDTLVRAGKVRYIGCSNFSAWQLMKSLAASDRLGLQRYVSQQINYSLLSREAEYELVPASLDQGVGILVWSPLAGGLLTGKYRRDADFPAGVRHASDWDEPPVHDWNRLWDIVDALVEVAEGHGVSASQVALRYLLDRPGVTSVLIGARTDEQLADNLGALELELTDADRKRLDDVSALPLLYPYWHQAISILDRPSVADLSLLGARIPPGEDPGS